MAVGGSAGSNMLKNFAAKKSDKPVLKPTVDTDGD
jgi:predicted alpha/beta-fold hydrolase